VTSIDIRIADCVEAMQAMDEASVDAIVTDPPYGLEFMGKEWDRLTWDERGRQPGDPENKGQTASPHRGSDAPTYVAGIRAQEWHQAWAIEALRVLKPGGHLLAFGGTRTYHRLACAVEDAGFEIRDSLIWLYGSGFPKSLDVSKAIDRAAGAEREVVGVKHAGRYPNGPGGVGFHGGPGEYSQVGRPPEPETAPATSEAQQWQGWGTALKPAHEPIVVARKPLIGTVAANVLEHGTGAINVDGCRIGSEPLRSPLKTDGTRSRKQHEGWTWIPDNTRHGPEEPCEVHGIRRCTICSPSQGRWPANVALSHLPECEEVGTRRIKAHWGQPTRGKSEDRIASHEGLDGERQAIGHADPDGTETIPAYSCAPGCPVAELDRQSGDVKGAVSNGRKAVSGDGAAGIYPGASEQVPTYGDTGGAARFFYCAKSSRSERNAGLDGFEEQRRSTDYGAMRKRECNVCGTRAAAPGAGGRWPNCEHGDWRWVEQLEEGVKGGNAANFHPT
jgi:hypothetical protein